MTRFRIVTTSPHAYVTHSEDKVYLEAVLQELKVCHPQTDFEIENEEKGPFFINPCNHFIEITVDSFGFKQAVERRLAARSVAA